MLVFVVKEIRLKKNISLYRLSKETKLSRTYLRDIENNKNTNPTTAVLERIAVALNVNIKDLFYSELDIENLRKEMYKRIEKFGIDSQESLEVSRIIDLLLNVNIKEQ